MDHNDVVREKCSFIRSSLLGIMGKDFNRVNAMATIWQIKVYIYI